MAHHGSATLFLVNLDRLVKIRLSAGMLILPAYLYLALHGAMRLTLTRVSSRQARGIRLRGGLASHQILIASPWMSPRTISPMLVHAV